MSDLFGNHIVGFPMRWLKCLETAVLLAIREIPGPKVVELFSCSAQLRLKSILLINVKMPTFVSILTFTSSIITGFGDLILKFQFIWAILSYMSSINLNLR